MYWALIGFQLMAADRTAWKVCFPVRAALCPPPDLTGHPAYNQRKKDTHTMNIAINAFAAPAMQLTTNTVAFIDANKAADNASTPFARSAISAVVGGLMSAGMVESMIVAAMGSPLSPKTGKAISKVSALRDFDGGARLYQAWKDVVVILDNLDADAATDHTIPGKDGADDTVVSIGTGAIRAAVVAFLLEEKDGATALFGAKGITATVKGLMAEHAKTVLAAYGVEAEKSDDDKGEGDKGTDANLSLTDRANAFLVAMRHASDDDMNAALEAIGAVADYIDARFAVVAPVETVEPVAVNG